MTRLPNKRVKLADLAQAGGLSVEALSLPRERTRLVAGIYQHRRGGHARRQP
jgi:hypothetical protein